MVSARQSHIQFIKTCVMGDEAKIEEWSKKIKDLISRTPASSSGAFRRKSYLSGRSQQAQKFHKREL